MTPIYAGSFDPLTLGHVDIVQRCLGLFGSCIVAVGHNPAKRTWFKVDERMELIRASVPTAQVVSFDGLLVDACETYGATCIIRGLRGVADFDSESRYALANRDLAGVETVFLVASPETSFLSSSLVKEIHSHGGDVSPYVPPAVMKALRERTTAK